MYVYTVDAHFRLLLGVFYIQGDFYPSHLTNCTFRNTSDPSSYTDGGVLFINSSSYWNFSINRCIFTQCKGFMGGVIFLGSLSPSIIINCCRFEMNTASYGYDIYALKSACFSPNTIRESCSTISAASIFCDISSVLGMMKDCEREIVFYFILFLI
jgi:hypothetical protein